MSDVAHYPSASTDEVTFDWSPGRLFVAKLAVGLIGSIIGTGAVALLVGIRAGRLPGRDDVWLLTYALAYPVFFSCFGLLFTMGRPPWLRIGAAGVELAASRTDPVFIPWSAISSARFRWRGPLAFLEIATNEPGAVVTLPRRGRRPRPRRRAGLVSFVVDVGALGASPATIRAELNHRGCPL